MPQTVSRIALLGNVSGKALYLAPITLNHYPIRWAHAMNTPFQWTLPHAGSEATNLADKEPQKLREPQEQPAL